MFAQRHRRWANNSPTLGQRLVFDRLHDRWRERTDTKLMWLTNVWWEVHLYRGGDIIMCWELLCLELKTILCWELLCFELNKIMCLEMLCLELHTILCWALLCLKLNTILWWEFLCLELKTILCWELLCLELNNILCLELLCLELNTILCWAELHKPYFMCWEMLVFS